MRSIEPLKAVIRTAHGAWWRSGLTGYRRSDNASPKLPSGWSRQEQGGQAASRQPTHGGGRHRIRCSSGSQSRQRLYPAARAPTERHTAPAAGSRDSAGLDDGDARLWYVVVDRLPARRTAIHSTRLYAHRYPIAGGLCTVLENSASTFSETSAPNSK